MRPRSALLAAALIGTAALGPAALHYVSDSQSALLVVAEGKSQQPQQGVAAGLGTVHAMREQLFPGRQAYAYVPGPAGVPLNEVADVLSKGAAGLETGSCGLSLPTGLCLHWLRRGAAKAAWISVVLRCCSGDPTLPPLQTLDLGDESHADILAPFVPSGVDLPGHAAEHSQENNSGASSSRLGLRCLTLNVLSLLDKHADSDATGVGLHMQPGRAALLANQRRCAHCLSPRVPLSGRDLPGWALCALCIRGCARTVEL